MKKISLVLILIILLGTFCSCGNAGEVSTTVLTTVNTNISSPVKKYTVLQSGFPDSSLGADHRLEINLSRRKTTGSHTSLSNVVIDGRNIELAKYEYSEGWIHLYNSGSHVYRFNNSDGTSGSFSINLSTGKILRYNYYDKEYAEKHKNDKILSEEECIELARAYLGTYVSDPEKYAITRCQKTSYQEYGDVYKISFSRYIGDVLTIDSIGLWITVYGDIVFHTSQCLGELTDESVLEGHNLNDIDTAIDAKLEKIYGSVEEYSYEKNASSMMLTRMGDGSYAMKCTVSVNLKSLDLEGYSFEEITEFIIYLD